MKDRTCDVCGGPTRVYPFHLGGHGPVDCLICKKGMADNDDAHPGIIERLPDNWRLLEMAEDEAFRALNRVPVNAADFSRAMKVKAAVGAIVLAVTLLLAWATPAHAGTEYGDMLYLMGTAAADKAVALDLIAMGACLALGATALRLVQLWREERRRRR
jgi:hypothetical protein